MSYLVPRFLARSPASKTSLVSRRALSTKQSSSDIPHVTLYTGTDCSLCDVVKDTLVKAQSETPFTVEYYNIRDDSLPDVHKWRRAYQYDIPVICLNGTEIARHRLDKSLLLEQLAKARNSESN